GRDLDGPGEGRLARQLAAHPALQRLTCKAHADAVALLADRPFLCEEELDCLVREPVAARAEIDVELYSFAGSRHHKGRLGRWLHGNSSIRLADEHLVAHLERVGAELRKRVGRAATQNRLDVEATADGKIGANAPARRLDGDCVS